jgi:YVTN family beta-propeller protein
MGCQSALLNIRAGQRIVSHWHMDITRYVVLLLTLLLTSQSRAAFDDLGSYVFVSSRISNVVSVIDTRRDKVVERISLPVAPDQILISEERRRLVASDLQGKRILVVDVDDMKPVTSIALEFPPEAVRIGADGRVLAAASSFNNALALIDLDDPSSMRLVDGIREPAYFTFDRPGRLLFVADSQGHEISVVDLKVARVSSRIDLDPPAHSGARTHSIAGFTRTPGGGFGFVMHGDSGIMSVVDLKEIKLLENVHLEGAAMRAYPTADSQYLLMVDDDRDWFSIISTWTLRETARLPAPKRVTAVATAFFDAYAFLISAKERRAVAIDLSRQRVFAELKLPGIPAGAVPSGDGLKLYVALQDVDQVAVVNVVTQKVEDLIDGVGVAPQQLSTVADRGYCH